jgi:hypothetical protein
MKLTEELKKSLDSMTFGQLKARFRFFPHSIYTQGEAGKYLQEILKDKKDSENERFKRQNNQ